MALLEQSTYSREPQTKALFNLGKIYSVSMYNIDHTRDLKYYKQGTDLQNTICPAK